MLGPSRSAYAKSLSSHAARLERVRLIERTVAGMDRARRQGKRIGRPSAEFDVERARALRGEGMSIRQVAATLGIGVATVHRSLKAARAGDP